MKYNCVDIRYKIKIFQTYFRIYFVIFVTNIDPIYFVFAILFLILVENHLFFAFKCKLMPFRYFFAKIKLFPLVRPTRQGRSLRRRLDRYDIRYTLNPSTFRMCPRSSEILTFCGRHHV